MKKQTWIKEALPKPLLCVRGRDPTEVSWEAFQMLPRMIELGNRKLGY